MTHGFSDHSQGHVYEDALVTVFFGDRRSEMNDVALSFPDFRLITIRQTHSDLVVLSPFEGETPEADAHMTRDRRLGLCIRTADCVPVMVEDPETGFVAAIHAGWKGVENEIVRKTIAKLASFSPDSGSALKQARAWIGPHIGVTSFEVGLDVAAKLEAAFDAVRGFSSEETVVKPHLEENKRYVDLSAIVRAQLRSSNIDSSRTRELVIDTVVSDQHCSFRRDRDKAGRQVSFIALK